MRLPSCDFNKLSSGVILLGNDFRVFGRITESWSQAGMAALSFTMIWEDLIGNPLFKQCQEICPEIDKKEKAKKAMPDVIQ